ncbi:hypothetical protein XF14_27835 [Burkholderia gladioli]|nr:hypothetical protein XF14_27835 [Burkholderia gladioli]
MRLARPSPRGISRRRLSSRPRAFARRLPTFAFGNLASHDVRIAWYRGHGIIPRITRARCCGSCNEARPAGRNCRPRRPGGPRRRSLRPPFTDPRKRLPGPASGASLTRDYFPFLYIFFSRS